MKIVVCIKQVPDVDNIKWTKENNLDRANMLSKINSYDVMALNYALEIKKRLNNSTITAISMGPNQAQDILNYALACGADEAILLSDRAFGGSDTLITSKIISRAIEKYVPDYKLIITGKLASDGDTRQVPLAVATLLDIAAVVDVCDIKNINDSSIEVVQKVEDSINDISLILPALISVCEFNKPNYVPKIDDYIRAQNNKIKIYDANSLEFDKSEVGIIGSPTMVYRAFRPEFTKEAVEVKLDFAKFVSDLLLTNGAKHE